MRNYLQLFQTPGSLSFCLAGLVTRAGGAMTGIGIVMMVSAQYDSYAWAGAVAASNSIAWAIGAAAISNLVDRFGQRRVMLPGAMISASALAVLVVLGTVQAPVWSLFPASVLCGASAGAPGALVRARWNHALRDKHQLHTAFSLESTLDELTFVVGPVAATFLATQIAPGAGLIAPILLSVPGSLWFYSLRATEPPVTPRRPEAASNRPLLTMPGVLSVAGVTVMVGWLFGATDVTVVAATEAWDAKSAAGIVLGAMSLGSALGGLGYGSRHWVSSTVRRWVLLLALLAASTVVFPFTGTVPILAVFGFITGFMIAPTLINLNTLVQGLVPTGRLTEGLAWVACSLGVGVSLGSTLAGQLIEQVSFRAGFWVVVAAGTTAVILGLVSARSVAGALRRFEL